MVSNRSSSSNQRDRHAANWVDPVSTGGTWQTLSRGDREEARPITGVLAMALIRNLFVGGFVEI
jgi:hypothetical protein